MNISPAHLNALQALGTPKRKPVFSTSWRRIPGTSCTSFLAFTSSHWGKRTTTFWSKLHTKKHARTERFPISGTVYHLFSRRLYRQIDRENIRNRRNMKSNTFSGASESSILSS